MRLKNNVAILVTLLLILAGGCALWLKQKPVCQETRPTTPPQRIVSLDPATTEIIFALGLGSRLVADTTACNFPEEAKKLPKIGSFLKPNLETLLTLHPDRMYGQGNAEAPEVQEMRTSGLPILVFQAGHRKDLEEEIRRIAEECDVRPAAEKLLKQLNEQFAEGDQIAATISPEDRPRVYFEIWSQPAWVPGNGSYINTLIGQAGGTNVTSDCPQEYAMPDQEEIVRRNPELILLGHDQKMGDPVTLFKERIGWSDVAAVKNGDVSTDINPDIILRLSSRLGEGYLTLCRKIKSVSEKKRLLRKTP